MIVDDFKQDCIKYKPEIVVQRFIIENSTYFFEEIEVGEEFDFKKDIATVLDIHIRDIIIVGSGKLGFSLKPDQSEIGLYRFKEFDFNYKNNITSKKSDLDIAIISSYSFDKEIKNLYDYTRIYSSSKWSNKKELAIYVLKGRLAIRFLPEDFQLSQEIQKIQQKYQEKYDREVNIEIYKSWYYFETYHQENIRNIQVNLLR